MMTPGCFEGSSGALSCSSGSDVAGAAARDAAATGIPARATRTRWPSCSISISVRPVSSSSLVSSRMRSRLTTATFGGFATIRFLNLRFYADQGREAADRQRISLDAEAGNYGFRRLRHVGILPEAFARVDIGDVNFDDRHLHRQERVENGDRGRRIAGRIKNDPGGFFCQRLLDPAHQFAFAVRLAEDDVEAEAVGGRAAKFFDVGKRRVAVFFRLAHAQKVEIGSVEDVKGLRHGGFRSGGLQSRFLKAPRFIGAPDGEGKPAARDFKALFALAIGSRRWPSR